MRRFTPALDLAAAAALGQDSQHSARPMMRVKAPTLVLDPPFRVFDLIPRGTNIPPHYRKQTLYGGAMFSGLVKSLRIEMRLTLRQFCLQAQLDPSNWSKVERGVIPPPGDAHFLENLAQFFKLDEAKKQEFLDTAAVARRELPADLVEDELFRRALPALFLAARILRKGGAR